MRICGARPPRQARPVRVGRSTVLRLHRPGAAPLRVLVVADRRTFDRVGGAAAFGDAAADRLQSAVGVDLDLAWDLAAVLDTIDTTADSWRLWRYEVVVLLRSERAAPDAAPLLEPSSTAIEAVSLLLETSVEVLLRGDGASDPGASVAGGSDAAPDVAAAALATRIEVLRTASGTSTSAEEADDEGGRQQALDRLRRPIEQLGDSLDRLVGMARDAFDSRFAAVNMLDGDDLWTVVAAGVDPGRQPRHAVLCNQTIQRTGLNVIPDTWSDPEASRLPVTRGPDAVRFYAAYPIESVEGYRIGTFCVWDDRPKGVDEFDFSILRDFALLAEGEIIESAR